MTMINYKIIICGIICLTIIEVIALMKGINGTLLTIIVGVISMSIGITIPNPIKLDKT